MEALFKTSSLLVPPCKLERISPRRELISTTRKKSVVLSQVEGNGMKSGGFPFVWTEVRPPMKTAAATEIGAATMETENLVLPSSRKNQTDVSEKNLSSSGIGIVNFLRGKSFFITGATGFLAKVLIEKILRTAPDVGKIFLLIKAKNNEAAMDRLKNEIINVELFKCLKQIHGQAYQNFMLSKLTPVVGDVCQSDLGLEPNFIDIIANEVDVIVNSAANTTFHERYDVAIDINTKGPSRLMGLAKNCKKLKLFLQVSTAYVNGQRQGNIMEKPFGMGDSIASETTIPDSLPVELNIEEELRLASSNHGKPLEDIAAVQKMKELGLERARTFGWQDTYVFTKAMGEMVIDNMRGDVPVVIIRPSVIESTCNEPFPGWIEGNRMIDPIVLYYGRGQLTGFLADPNGVIDVVPADMVVNATLAAMAKHGEARKPGINVYQIASSVVNPLVFKDLAESLYEHYNSSPCMDSKGNPIQVPSMKLFSSSEEFAAHLWQDALNRSWLATTTSLNDKISHKLEAICRKEVEQAKNLAHIYEPYTFYGGRFDNSNTERLMKSMHEEEKSKFGFDVKSIDWKDYIKNVHIPGLRRHVMKRRGMCS